MANVIATGQQLPENIGEITASLAAELATRLLPTQEVLHRHGLTAAQLQVLMHDEQFKHQIRDYRAKWNAPLSARDRVKAKASLAVEDGLLELHRMYHDVTVNPTARLEAFKQLVQLADMQPKQNQVSQGTSFSLSIELTGDASAQGITINAEPENNAGSEDAISTSVGEDRGD